MHEWVDDEEQIQMLNLFAFAELYVEFQSLFAYVFTAILAQRRRIKSKNSS